MIFFLISFIKASLFHFEKVLRQSFIRVIGRELHERDFRNYLEFHRNEFFKPKFRPKPCCFPVRMNDHDPEGIFGITIDSENFLNTFYTSHCNREMRISLSDVKLQIRGDLNVHGFVVHQFHRPLTHLSFSARTKRFGSFVVILGKLVGKNTIEPQCSLLLGDLDTLEVMLDVTTIPSKKEFQERVQSLSLNQIDFANQIR